MATQEMRLFLHLYFDENVATQLALFLRSKKYDAVTAHEAGMLGKSDPEQFAFAVSHQRTIVTHDREDYTDLHTQFLKNGQTHYGIVILIQRPQLAKIREHLLTFLNDVTADEMENQLRFV